MSLSDDIRAAKEKLPLPDLMRTIGDGEYAKASAPSPFRNGDNKHCFGIFKKGDGLWNFKDQVTGEFGDEIDYLEKRRGISKEDATNEFLRLAGIQRVETHSKFQAAMARRSQIAQPVGFNWSARVGAFAEHVPHVASWRGLSPEFLEALRVAGGIGWNEGGVAFPVHDQEGCVTACHYRKDDGTWRFEPQGTAVAPYTIGNPRVAKEILIFESQWDAMAFADKLGWHHWQTDKPGALIATRGASNGKLVAPYARDDVKFYIVPQNDKPDLKTGKVPSEEWARSVIEALPGVVLHRLNVPKEHKDPNDWVKAGGSFDDITRAMEEARRERKSTLSVRTVGEIFNMTFDDSDNYFGDRIIAAGQPVTILGPGGIGKSRLIIQQALCMITGRDFLDMPTHAHGKRWLLLQTENSTRRLQNDLKNMIIQMKFGADIELINKSLFIHTIETPEDAMLDLEDEKNLAQIAGLIEDYNPDFVVFDPLNTFTALDLNSDRDMKAVVSAITRTTKRGNPNRVPYVVHHSLTGKSGAARSVGWDKASYGRNSKVLQAWTRAQINVAPQDPDNPAVLVMSCGKNNNGKSFPDIGIIYDEKLGYYRINPDFDPAEFRESIGVDAAKPNSAIVKIEDIPEMFADSIDRKTLLKRISDAFSCHPKTAFRALEKAEKAKLIVAEKGRKWNPTYRKANPEI